MDIVNFILFLVLPIVLLGGALVWAFGRKRKARFEADARIPFRDEPPGAAGDSASSGDERVAPEGPDGPR
jgi:cytochrome c oxidase cbb3-type subunit IV